jgi:predicted GNAT family acetyltransferase
MINVLRFNRGILKNPYIYEVVANCTREGEVGKMKYFFNGQECTIYKLEVAPKRRREGISQTLLQNMLKHIDGSPVEKARHSTFTEMGESCYDNYPTEVGVLSKLLEKKSRRRISKLRMSERW